MLSGAGPHGAARPARRKVTRSRRGCAPCRKRKIKCDEVTPQCGGCRKSGRSCAIIDGLFRPHPYTFAATAAVVGDDAAAIEERAAQADTDTLDVDRPGVQPQEWSPSAVHDVQQHDPQIDAGEISETVSHSRPNTGTATSHERLTSVLVLSRQSTILTRNYVESLATNLDLIAGDHYFSRRVLRLAHSSDLVRSAMCAAAAKQLGHMSTSRDHAFQDDTFEVRKDNGRPDFLWYGAKHYGESIQAMMAAGMSSTPTADEPSLASRHNTNDQSEAILAAAYIMCAYERLSASFRAWARHINAASKLLGIDRMSGTTYGGLDNLSPITSMPRSIAMTMFWTFVQNDMEESLTSHRPTRVNTSDSTLWAQMGVRVARFEEQRCASSPTFDDMDQDIDPLRTILFLLCKSVNLIATRSRNIVSPESTRSLQDRPEVEDWMRISREVQSWEIDFLGNLTPDLVSAHQPNTSNLSTFANESWFSSPVNAMACAYYHMVVQLLHIHTPCELSAGMNIPAETSVETAYDNLSRYRILQRRLSHHSQQTVSIALGRPGSAVMMHMLQPLYVSGRCLTNEQDQRQLVGLLVKIERDHGVATGYRIKSLMEEWQISWPQGTSELDAELDDLSASE